MKLLASIAITAFFPFILTSADAKGISGICDRFKNKQQDEQNQQQNQQQYQQQPEQKQHKHRQQNLDQSRLMWCLILLFCCLVKNSLNEQKLEIPLKTKVTWAVGKKNVVVKFRFPLHILCEKFRSVKKTMTSGLKKMLFQKKSEIVENVIRFEI